MGNDRQPHIQEFRHDTSQRFVVKGADQHVDLLRDLRSRHVAAKIKTGLGSGGGNPGADLRFQADLLLGLGNTVDPKAKAAIRSGLRQSQPKGHKAIQSLTPVKTANVTDIDRGFGGTQIIAPPHRQAGKDDRAVGHGDVRGLQTCCCTDTITAVFGIGGQPIKGSD